nr:MAG TPA: hypothetical protein [Caudoviricetes sp.]
MFSFFVDFLAIHFLRLLLVRVAAFFHSCYRIGIDPAGRWLFCLLFRTFSYFILETRWSLIRIFLCEGSFWRFKLLYEPALKKAKDSSRKLNLYLFLPQNPTSVCLCQRIVVHRKNRKSDRALYGMK